MSFDFDAAVAAPFRMQPGLRRIAPGQPQLTPHRPGARALREKLAVLSNAVNQALLAAPGFNATPALAALCAHAAREHPSAWRGNCADAVDAPQIGWGLRGDTPQGDGPREFGACLRALPPPWRLAGLLSLAFAEDFAVVDAATGRIPWLAVCLPSHWAPEDKVGRPFAEVHAPVADNATLIAASTHLMRLVTRGERWERFVWTVTPHAALDAHPRRSPAPPWPAEPDAAGLVALAHFRTERQTFIPVPGQAQAVFTIHVESTPLLAAIATASQAHALHAALASMSPAVLAYRGLATGRDRLLAWLAARSA